MPPVAIAVVQLGLTAALVKGAIGATAFIVSSIAIAVGQGIIARRNAPPRAGGAEAAGIGGADAHGQIIRRPARVGLRNRPQGRRDH